MPKATKRARSLLEQIADMADPRPKDVDIEDADAMDTAVGGGQAGSSDEESGDEELRREHYVNVGTSALRQQQGIGELGPKYTGSRISRRDLYSDDSSSGEEAMGEGDGSDEDVGMGDSAESAEDSDDDDDDVSDDSESDAGSSFSSGAERAGGSANRLREEVRRLEEGERALLSSITQTARSDVEKGQHVLAQTRMWEGALDARIRVQKLATAANELPQPAQFGDLVAQRFAAVADEEPSKLDTARQSVTQLLQSLIALRTTLAEQNPAVGKARDSANGEEVGQKRKAADPEDDTNVVWQELSTLRAEFRPFRDESLDKWGSKAQVAAGAVALKKFKAVNQGIMHQITQTLATSDRLVERTRLRRVDYNVIGRPAPDAGDAGEQKPVVDAHLRDTDPEIFDDTDFYQQLLRELIESRMVDSNDPTGSLGVRWAAVSQRQSAKRRNVDTRASKGRKVRYHVMDKLQSFMPPVPAGTWHEDMVNELFASLLGQRVPQSILEADELEPAQSTEPSSSAAAPANGINGGEQGLRLFG
ncbi:rRNA-processing protein bfr2 [Coemansia sp. RSA 552]|nr:rRNA-processing protein bfr2 [Coemansia sp. RSA 552]